MRRVLVSAYSVTPAPTPEVEEYEAEKEDEDEEDEEVVSCQNLNGTLKIVG